MSIEEAQAIRARQDAVFDADADVARMWAARARPTLDHLAVPLATLLPAIAAGADAAGERFGRRTGEGAPWTFVGQGTGIVVAVDTTSRRGVVEVTVDDTRPAQTVQLEIGPVVSGTAIRDALPFIAFDGYPDQLAFADVGRALTQRALAGVRPHLAGLRPGMRVRFVGAFNVREPNDALLLTPVRLDRAG